MPARARSSGPDGVGDAASTERRRAAVDQAFLDSLLSAAPVALGLVDLDLRFVHCNGALAELTAARATDHVGRSVREVIPAMAPELERLHRRVVETERQVVDLRVEGSTPTDAGDVRRWVVSGYPVRGLDGGLVGVGLIVNDVTERARHEERAALARSLLEATLESTADGILVVDLEGRIVSTNRRFVRMWDIPEEVLEAGDDDRALALVLDRLAEPEAFLAKVRELYAHPEAESLDELAFTDGRVVERFSMPQRLEEEIVGRVWSFRDVTEQRRIESEYRSLVDRLPAVVYVAEPGIGAPWHYVSPRIESMLGFTADEWRSDPMTWYRQVHPDDRDRVMAEEVGSGVEGKLVSEYRIAASDGRMVWVRDEAEFVPGPREGRGELRGLMYDITQRKQMEDELRQTVERLRLLTQATNDAIWDWDLVGDDHWWNDRFDAMWGHDSSVEAPTVEAWASRVHADDRDRVVSGFLAAAAGEGDGDQWTDEYRFVRPDGSVGYVLDRGLVMHDADGERVRMLGAMLDVSARRSSEEERRQLLAHQVSAQEDERRRIAEDIHDDSIQAMTAVGIRLATLTQQVTDERAHEALVRVQRAVESAIARLRHLMFQLRPRVLDEEGLAPTLRVLLGQMSEDDGLDFRLDDQLAQEPPREARAILYRIAQEALANVRKHARGAAVEVTLGARDDGYFVRVRDEGEGFDARVLTDSPSGHMGLSSMRERAEMAGGWWRVESAPGRGTTVESWIPAGSEPAP